jgi:hypothetical protein
VLLAAWGDTEVWLPIITLVLGAVLALATESWRDERQREHAKSEREELRRAELADRREVFQVETLLSLQDAMARLGESLIKIFYARLMDHQQSGLWRLDAPSAESLADNDTARVDVAMLVQRVRDNGLRDVVNEAQLACAKAKAAMSADAAWDRYDDSLQRLNKAQQRLGQVLRSTYMAG